MSEPAAPDLDAARARRRDPAERRVSRVSGGLLLLVILQGAFGYSLVGLATSQWVRDVHLLLGLVLLGLCALAAAYTRLLPIRDGRTRALEILSRLLVALATVQLVLGFMIRGWIPSSANLTTAHVGLGLLVTLIIVVIHILAIGPSLLLSAAREYEKSRSDLDAKQSR